MTISRNARLIRLSGVGDGKFRKLGRARIALVGLGTLGGAYAINLARMGVGYLRLIDRDIVEEHNLSTQILFDEEDVRRVRPKAVAAKVRLQSLNSKMELEAHSSELDPSNATRLLEGIDLILDATDNFEARFLLNDVSLKFKIPWIYTGMVGYSGTVMAVIPGRTACLRCLMADPPEAGQLPTCETIGVWAPGAQAVVAVGLTEVLRLLTGRKPTFGLSELDFQSGSWRKLQVKRKEDCPACGRQEFAFLDGKAGSRTARLCGRDMVHLSPRRNVSVNLSALADQLGSSFEVALTEDLMRLRVPEADIYLFPDGRALVKGTSDPSRARAIYNRYISA